MLIYGIPQFRLPKEIVNEEINGLKAWRGDLTNTVIGKTMTVEELFEKGYEAILSARAPAAQLYEDTGESLNGVYSATSF